MNDYKWGIRKDVKGSYTVSFQLLASILTGGTEEKNEKFESKSGWKLNLA
jgi:hypothetical protein